MAEFSEEQYVIQPVNVSLLWTVGVLIGVSMGLSTAPTESEAAMWVIVTLRDENNKQQPFFGTMQLDFLEHKALLEVKVRED